MCVRRLFFCNFSITVCITTFISFTISMQVQVTNKKLVRRHGHSAAPLAITPECVKVIMFGGKRKLNGSNIADTTALRFGKD